MSKWIPCSERFLLQMERFTGCAVYLSLQTLRMAFINGKIITDTGMNMIHGLHGCPCLNRIERKGEQMSDLISRQAAIDAIQKLTIPEDMCVFEIMSHIEVEIATLPSVTPKQKRGKWINGYCSECGKHAPFWAMATTYYKSSFCPKCGARMDGEIEGKSKK